MPTASTQKRELNAAIMAENGRNAKSREGAVSITASTEPFTASEEETC